MILKPKTVLIISPYSGNLHRNKVYLNRCIKFVIRTGNAPFAPHYLYPNFLDDFNPEERERGMGFGRAWGLVCETAIVFMDYGLSKGMAEDVGFLKLERDLDPDTIYIGENPDA